MSALFQFYGLVERMAQMASSAQHVVMCCPTKHDAPNKWVIGIKVVENELISFSVT